MEEKVILLVAMNEKVRARISEVAERAGYKCEVMQSFDDAQREVATRKFDSIFVDVHLDNTAKDRRGFEFVRDVRQKDGPNKEANVVMLLDENVRWDMILEMDLISTSKISLLRTAEEGFRQRYIIKALHRRAGPPAPLVG